MRSLLLTLSDISLGLGASVAPGLKKTIDLAECPGSGKAECAKYHEPHECQQGGVRGDDGTDDQSDHKYE